MDLLFLGSSFVFSAQGGRGKEKNCKPAEKIAVGSEGGAEGQNSQSGFPSKKVRILTKRYRQFSEFGFWAIVASPRQRRGSASARILKGFLKSKNNFCPLKRKFEPIFLRKSRPCSGFSCKAIISACFTVFMNLAASSNRLLLFCSKAVSLSFKSCF